jgi:predicted transcriptional regulator
MAKPIDIAVARPYCRSMALPAVKTTYSLDQETVRLLDQLADRWGESRSGALRRAIRDAASGAGINDRLAALDAWQKSMALSPAAAKAWADESRAMRRASSRKSIERVERASRIGRRRSR